MEPALDVRSLLRDGVVEPAPRTYSVEDPRDLREFLLSLAETMDGICQIVGARVASEVRFVATHLRCSEEAVAEEGRHQLSYLKAGEA